MSLTCEQIIFRFKSASWKECAIVGIRTHVIMLFIFLHIYFVYVDFVSLINPESSHSDQGQLSLYFDYFCFFS